MNDVLEDLKEGKAELEREDQTFHNFGVEPPMEVFNEFEKFITSWQKKMHEEYKLNFGN